MNNSFWIGMIVPTLAAIVFKVWDISHANNKNNRDIMVKILIQLERHEALFTTIQQDIKEFKESM